MASKKSSGRHGGDKDHVSTGGSRNEKSSEPCLLKLNSITKESNWLKWDEEMYHYALEKQGAWISECLLKRTWLPRVMKSSRFQYEEFDPEDEELEIEEDYEGLDEDEAREKRGRIYCIKGYLR